MLGLAMALDWGKINALAAKIRTKKDLPVVVIGAGLGGLCCGALYEKKGIENCLAEMQGIVDELESLKVNRNGRNLPTQYPSLWKIKDKTIATFVDEFIREPDLKESLTDNWQPFGLPPSKLSAFMYIMANASGENDPYYIKRRSQDLSNALAESIEASGGQMRYENMIEKILLKNKAVSGVVTSQGEHLPAKIVVSNASAIFTLKRKDGQVF